MLCAVACGEPVVGFRFTDAGGTAGGGGGSGAGGGGAAGGIAPQPVELEAMLANPDSIALDTDRIYFAEDTATGAVWSCPKTGCGGTRLLIKQGQTNPGGVALLGPNLLWTQLGAASNGTLETVGMTLLTGQSWITGTVTDADHVYFAHLQSSGSVETCRFSDCINTKVTLMSGLPLPGRLALDMTFVYAASFGPPGSVDRCPKVGCPDGGTRIASNQVNVSGIAVDPVDVYWISDDATNGQVLACPKTGCVGAPRVIASGQPNCFDLALDTGRVYWTTRNDVRSCPSPGCPDTGPTVHASTNSPRGLALDSAFIYWGSGSASGGTLHRVAR